MSINSTERDTSPELPTELQEQIEVRKARLRAVVASIDRAGKYSSLPAIYHIDQKYKRENDETSDLELEIDLGGWPLKVVGALGREPMIEILSNHLDPRHKVGEKIEIVEFSPISVSNYYDELEKEMAPVRAKFPEKFRDPVSPELKKAVEMKAIKSVAAVSSIAEIMGGLSRIPFQRFQEEGNVESDLIADCDFGGWPLRVVTPLHGDPFIKFLRDSIQGFYGPRGKYKRGEFLEMSQLGNLKLSYERELSKSLPKSE